MAAQRQLLKEESALGNDSDNCFLGHLGLEPSVGGRTRRDNSHEEEMKDLEVCEKRNKQQFQNSVWNDDLLTEDDDGDHEPTGTSARVTSVHPASPATLPTNPTEARSSLYLNPPQPLCPLRSTTELGKVLEPGYLGSSGQWDMMRPQKRSISGDLSSGSSKYQLHSKPTGKYKPNAQLVLLWGPEGLGPAKEALGPRALPPPAQQPRSETCCSEQRRALDRGEVGDEPAAAPQDPAALPVNGHRRPGPAAKGRSDRSTATPCRVTLGLETGCSCMLAVEPSPSSLGGFFMLMEAPSSEDKTTANRIHVIHDFQRLTPPPKKDVRESPVELWLHLEGLQEPLALLSGQSAQRVWELADLSEGPQGSLQPSGNFC
ncbi:hypothetical protein AB1E18_002390 [Capra hircus]